MGCGVGGMGGLGVSSFPLSQAKRKDKRNNARMLGLNDFFIGFPYPALAS
jgi:hypothetical protein